MIAIEYYRENEKDTQQCIQGIDKEHGMYYDRKYTQWGYVKTEYA